MSPRVAALLLALVLAANAESQIVPPMTPEQWRADVDFFARELPRKHKNAFHTVTRERFAAEVAALRERAGTASANEMIVGFMRLTALVGDGHTRVNLPPMRGYPIGVVKIEGVNRIVRGAGPAAELVGGRLVKIDETPLDEAIARIRTIIPQAESEILIEARTPQWFGIADVLHGLGITRSPTSARYTAVLDDGSERSADLTVMESGAKPDWRTAAASQPLYRQRLGESFWFQWIPEAETVFVAFRKYDDLRAKSRELWSFVDSHPVRKIAIDLRLNGGGDYNVGRKYLVDELAKRPKLRGYVLTSANTFSAALKTAIDFRQVAKATLAGETIGERPNSYSENDEMTLPKSRLNLSYSTRYYQFLPNDDGLVTPDQEIHPTWADWVAGRDPVMEWVLRQ
jgi:hypothetical protein